MQSTPARLSLYALAVFTLAAPTAAQQAPTDAKGAAAPPDAAQGAAAQKSADPFAGITWVDAGGAAKLSTHATFTVPEKCRFAEAIGARQFLEATENIPDGDEIGIAVCDLSDDDSWFAIFSFDESGYVKDDEKDKLDAAAILKSIQEGTAEANEERKRRGWSTMSVDGWATAPFYDAVTQNLTWAIRGSSSDGGSSVNHSVRLLGRSGVMKVQVVFGPASTQPAVAAFTDLLKSYSFNPGSRYSEWRDGDKVASYGLTALVAGGAGVALAKSGLLAKFWKLIVLGVVGVFGAAKRFFGKKGTTPDQS